MTRTAARSAADKRDALAVVFQAYRRYGRKPFKVDPLGRNMAALKAASSLDWVDWVAPNVAQITARAVEALAPYRGPE